MTTLRVRDDVTLVHTGPLTDLAVALQRAPEVAGRIRRGLVLMGGSVGVGNVTPAAEFNIWHDPEAAEIVFGSGIPIWMCGLNLTHQATMDETTVEAFERIDTHAARVTASHAVSTKQHEAPVQGHGVDARSLRGGGADRADHHDVGPDARAGRASRGSHTRGMTICDARHLPAFQPFRHSASTGGRGAERARRRYARSGLADQAARGRASVAALVRRRARFEAAQPLLRGSRGTQPDHAEVSVRGFLERRWVAAPVERVRLPRPQAKSSPG